MIVAIRENHLKNAKLLIDFHLTSINHRNSRLTKLTKTVQSNDIELVIMIINHPLFEKYKSQIDAAIKKKKIEFA